MVLAVLIILLQFAIKTFDLVLALTHGGPGISTTFPAVSVYDRLFAAGELAQGGAVAVWMLIGLLNGFALTKWKMPGGGVIFVAITIGVFLPPQVGLLPWAIALSWLGLSKTLTGLALVHIIQGTCFTTLFYRNYLINLPDDLIRASRIDGAGFLRTFLRIAVPLSPPIIVVVLILQFTFFWNEFLFAVTFSSAVVLIAAIPPLVLYFFGRRFFVRGLPQGAVR